jgi:acetate kinase
MKILVINAGSSSCKYQLFNMDDQSVLCSGVVERIGQPMGKLSHKIAPGSDKEEKIVVERPFPTHVEGMEDVISLLLDSEKGVIQDKSEISAIGHRVLHGGEAITDPVLIDEKVKEIIRDCFPLGPLHNPANLMGIDVAEKLFPGVPNVGVFDTEFGMTLKRICIPCPTRCTKSCASAAMASTAPPINTLRKRRRPSSASPSRN